MLDLVELSATYIFADKIGKSLKGIGYFGYKATKNSVELGVDILRGRGSERLKKKLILLAIDNSVTKVLTIDAVSTFILESEKTTSLVLRSRQKRLQASFSNKDLGCCMGCAIDGGLIVADLINPVFWVWGLGDFVTTGEAIVSRSTSGEKIDSLARGARVIVAITPFLPSRLCVPIFDTWRARVEDKVAEKVDNPNILV